MTSHTSMCSVAVSKNPTSLKKMMIHTQTIQLRAFAVNRPNIRGLPWPHWMAAQLCLKDD